MFNSQRSFTCLRCSSRLSRQPNRRYNVTAPLRVEAISPTNKPKAVLDIKRIRADPAGHEQNCIDRNYKAQAAYPARIVALYKQWQTYQEEGQAMRVRNNKLKKRLASLHGTHDNGSAKSQAKSDASIEEMDAEQAAQEARVLKERLASIIAGESSAMAEITSLAAAIPNWTSDKTPRGNEPLLVGTINEHPGVDVPGYSQQSRSHVEIGSELDLLDFAGAATTSGWGWYFLLNEAAQLEQALVQYALKVAREHGWGMVSPPSMVYSHIASACGFQPRDQNGESQIYNVQQSEDDIGRKPEHSLTGTAEIPLAAMRANTTFPAAKLPIKNVGVSRAYRAEAGARGVDTKGLYRVHEFTKVEMFGWTAASEEEATAVFDEMLSIQNTILKSLGLHCRVLEMPSTDLGASAIRKRDIEAYFPSRQSKDEGYGEVTSTSICSDYQSRRLNSRVRHRDGRLTYPFTVNGTAMAVPRVLAAILENGWDETRKEVKIPEALWPWMDGVKVITPKAETKE
ncbi:seryl-trna synthetase [Phlyctema vagabunda]|uniref:serine--tRNA ligase n=1 Tax=Phlyctema vagabunda TaxID=108571 RepID=A0ABR4PY76_9HELO